MNNPFVIFALSFSVLCLATWIGTALGGKWELHAERREDFGVTLGATLTLLALIIGFTFSLAISRYDQRKNYEEAEANAIGTEYVRADLLPKLDAVRLTGLLASYIDQRILFYRPRDERALPQIGAETARLQNEMWLTVRVQGVAKPTPVNALVLSGMNDVLNSERSTQAAWWNRIPTSAWALMGLIAICCSVLIGYNTRRTDGQIVHLVTLPLLVSIAFLLIADLDSPRGGFIQVNPENLASVSESFHAR